MAPFPPNEEKKLLDAEMACWAEKDSIKKECKKNIMPFLIFLCILFLLWWFL